MKQEIINTTIIAEQNHKEYLETIKNRFNPNELNQQLVALQTKSDEKVQKSTKPIRTDEEYIYELFAITEVQVKEIKMLKEQLAEKDKTIIMLKNKLQAILDILQKEADLEEKEPVRPKRLKH